MKLLSRLLPVLTIICFVTQELPAQSEFWGTTRWGGVTTGGVVFKTDNDGTNPQTVYSFTYGVDGGEPYGGLIQAANGKLYGTTYGGGMYSFGVLYEIDPATGTFTKKLDFDSINTGSNCMSTLFQASNGKLYGTSWSGGTADKGVLFEYDIPSNIITKIIDFDGPINGAQPYNTTLMEASNGKLYGTVAMGGANNNGILFEYDPVTSVFIKKLDFVSASTGAGPAGRLTEVAPGILYGSASDGGANGGGVIFEYNNNTNILTTKINLDLSITGSRIYDGLMQAANGKLYALAQSGGPGYAGTMVEFDIATSQFTNIIDFGTLDTGLLTTWEPYGSPMQASNGKIYGTSAYGSNGGDLFEYDIVTDTYLPLFDFDAAINASSPYYLRLIEVNTPPADV